MSKKTEKSVATFGVALLAIAILSCFGPKVLWIGSVITLCLAFVVICIIHSCEQKKTAEPKRDCACK